MKKNKLQVGITGGIGSGKSLICKIFSALGVSVYDADTRAKWLTNNDETIKNKVVEHFGKKSYNSNGLNRSYISSIVFKDQTKLTLLNSIIHPAVGKDYVNWFEQQQSPYTIKEAALMFESGSYENLDRIINVSAPIELRIRRVLQRDSFRSEKEVRSIIDKQLSEEERSGRSDYLIHNDGSQMVVPQVLKLHNQFMEIDRLT